MRPKLMPIAAVLLAVIASPSRALAQGKLEARWERNSTVRVSQGRNTARVDVGKDIAGCTSDVFDRTTNQKFGSGLRQTQVLDVTSSDGQHFVLLSAVAAPNCNVQGRCGAGDDNVTLIWLHLGGDLSLVRVQAFAVEDCGSARWVNDVPDDWRSTLKLSGGALKVNFTESVYDRATDKLQDTSGHAVYDRQQASAGIQITRAPK